MLNVVEQLVELGNFFGFGGASDHVAREGFGQSGLLVAESRHMGDTVADDHHKGVSVKVAEWRHAMAAATDFDRFSESQFLFVILVPESFGLFITAGGGFMEGISRLAELCVERDNGLPVDVGQPGTLHFRCADFFLEAVISWTVSLW